MLCFRVIYKTYRFYYDKSKTLRFPKISNIMTCLKVRNVIFQGGKKKERKPCSSHFSAPFVDQYLSVVKINLSDWNMGKTFLILVPNLTDSYKYAAKLNCIFQQAIPDWLSQFYYLRCCFLQPPVHMISHFSFCIKSNFSNSSRIYRKIPTSIHHQISSN